MDEWDICCKINPHASLDKEEYNHGIEFCDSIVVFPNLAFQQDLNLQLHENVYYKPIIPSFKTLSLYRYEITAASSLGQEADKYTGESISK